MAQPRAIGESITSIISRLEQQLDGVRDEFLMGMAEDLVQNSPIWSGRYVTSHSIGTSSSAGQFTGNLERPAEKTTVPEAYRAEGRANLAGNIAALPAKTERVYLNNNAPHAYLVEYGGVNMGAHGVYEGVINRANIHLQDAINKVKGGQ